MVSIYLDDCISDHRLARPLRSAGHLLHVPIELGKSGQSDEAHLETAASLGAVLATHNQQDFAPIHHTWQRQGRSHAGILLVRQELALGLKAAALERAARLRTPECSANQLMELALFSSEERARLYVLSLSGTG